MAVPGPACAFSIITFLDCLQLDSPLLIFFRIVRFIPAFSHSFEKFQQILGEFQTGRVEPFLKLPHIPPIL